MTTFRIAFPESLNIAEAARFTCRLSEVPSADAYVLDASRLGNVEPFGMLLVAAALRRFRRERTTNDGPRPTFACEGHRANSMAAYYGFFDACGIRYGLPVGDAPGGPTYIPISKLTVSDLLDGDKYSKPLLIQRIQSESERLAKVMAQGHEMDMARVVAYSLREILRNAFEHARVVEVWYCAQYWPARQRIEVAVLDEGDGVRQSLRRNPAYQPGNDLEAIRLAVREGVSGVVYREPTLEDRALEEREYGMEPSFFSNSGYGLFLCRANLPRRGKHAHLQWRASRAVQS